jgi:hypothetical protein
MKSIQEGSGISAESLEEVAIGDRGSRERLALRLSAKSLDQEQLAGNCGCHVFPV